MCGYVIVGSYLVERGNGSRGVAAEAIASLDRGDGALEVGTVQQLRELQHSVAQDEQLGQIESGTSVSKNYVRDNRCTGKQKDKQRQDRNVKFYRFSGNQFIFLEMN